MRDARAEDIPIFFEQQRDAESNEMAAFTAPDRNDRAAFVSHWNRILTDTGVMKQTIVSDGAVAGHILCFMQFGKRSVGYWLGKEFWGRGLATAALRELLATLDERPLYARAAQDNVASLRVLQKCGFVICGEDKAFSNARGCEVREYLLKLSAKD